MLPHPSAGLRLAPEAEGAERDGVWMEQWGLSPSSSNVEAGEGARGRPGRKGLEAPGKETSLWVCSAGWELTGGNR
jgi:hypothetical protein